MDKLVILVFLGAISFAYFETAAAIPAHTSDVTKWKCDGQKLGGQDIWQEAVEKCAKKKHLCRNVCIWQKLKVLSNDLQYSHSELEAVVEGSVKAADLRRGLKDGFLRCSRKIDDTDRHDSCYGNRNFLACIADVGREVCNANLYGYSGESTGILIAVQEPKPVGLLTGVLNVLG